MTANISKVRRKQRLDTVYTVVISLALVAVVSITIFDFSQKNFIKHQKHNTAHENLISASKFNQTINNLSNSVSHSDGFSPYYSNIADYYDPNYKKMLCSEASHIMPTTNSALINSSSDDFIHVSQLSTVVNVSTGDTTAVDEQTIALNASSHLFYQNDEIQETISFFNSSAVENSIRKMDVSHQIPYNDVNEQLHSNNSSQDKFINSTQYYLTKNTYLNQTTYPSSVSELEGSFSNTKEPSMFSSVLSTRLSSISYTADSIFYNQILGIQFSSIINTSLPVIIYINNSSFHHTVNHNVNGRIQPDLKNASNVSQSELINVTKTLKSEENEDNTSYTSSPNIPKPNTCFYGRSTIVKQPQCSINIHIHKTFHPVIKSNVPDKTDDHCTTNSYNKPQVNTTNQTDFENSQLLLNASTTGSRTGNHSKPQWKQRNKYKRRKVIINNYHTTTITSGLLVDIWNTLKDIYTLIVTTLILVKLTNWFLQIYHFDKIQEWMMSKEKWLAASTKIKQNLPSYWSNPAEAENYSEVEILQHSVSNHVLNPLHAPNTIHYFQLLDMRVILQNMPSDYEVADAYLNTFYLVALQLKYKEMAILLQECRVYLKRKRIEQLMIT